MASLGPKRFVFAPGSLQVYDGMLGTEEQPDQDPDPERRAAAYDVLGYDPTTKSFTPDQWISCLQPLSEHDTRELGYVLVSDKTPTSGLTSVLKTWAPSMINLKLAHAALRQNSRARALPALGRDFCNAEDGIGWVTNPKVANCLDPDTVNLSRMTDTWSVPPLLRCIGHQPSVAYVDLAARPVCLTYDLNDDEVTDLNVLPAIFWTQAQSETGEPLPKEQGTTSYGMLAMTAAPHRWKDEELFCRKLDECLGKSEAYKQYCTLPEGTDMKDELGIPGNTVLASALQSAASEGSFAVGLTEAETAA